MSASLPIFDAMVLAFVAKSSVWEQLLASLAELPPELAMAA